MNKFCVICSDDTSVKVEKINYELICLMMVMTKKLIDYEDRGVELLKLLIEDGTISQLNMIRAEIISLVNTEIGDGTEKNKFMLAVDESNTKFKNKLSSVLNKTD